ncbi:hypothetical protein FHR24_002529 [Wenyingzhuangia heitensis]|uniref:Outer membrane protein beta-barrel domain-containing protein n=1 Tax=Wenyingzhuangia heitensis TaxID=1487859 RepID=A0ABX0UFU5_9FLAO|nr:autotransporter domain-containing protein [Wenyingzhuangia heitensis]NIJ46051.1 hypothetical protein [Wenyingzhuangia heitensis]
MSAGKSETENVDGTNYESKSFSINPSVGYFIEDNLVVGLSARYNKIKTKENSNTEYDDSNYGVGVYAEKYYKLYKSFFLSVSGNANFINNDNDKNDIENRFYTIGVSPSISCVLNKHMSIKVGFDNVLGYTYRTYNNQGNSGSSSGFVTDLGDSDLSVGFRYFF